MRWNPSMLLRMTGVLLALFTTRCSRSGELDNGPSPDGGRGNPSAIPVAAVEVRPQDLSRTVTVTGPIEPIRTVSVNSQTAGTVVNVLVEEGDRVRRGQRLAELDAKEVSAQLARAKAVLANAEAVYQRSSQLESNDLATAAELDAVRSAYEIAKADVQLWQTRVDFCRITAPVAGVVTAKQVERGSTVSPNDAMFEIADDSLLVVRVRVSELDVVHLQPGRGATLQLDAYPSIQLTGHIRRIFPSADAMSRLVPVEVVLDRTPPGVDAKPGFLARVEFALNRQDSVLAVPAAAVGVSEAGTFVYVVQADTLVRKPVETGLTASGWIAIEGGLHAGERVVSSGHVNLRPGAVVRITGETQPPGGTQ